MFFSCSEYQKVLKSEDSELKYSQAIEYYNNEDYSTPVFLDKSKQLIDELKSKHPGEISNLMSLSDKLTSLNVDR